MNPPRKAQADAGVNALPAAGRRGVVRRGGNGAQSPLARRAPLLESPQAGPGSRTEAWPERAPTAIVAALELARIYFPQ